jgi:RNA polymerase sigma factor (sigma-70 family)
MNILYRNSSDSDLWAAILVGNQSAWTELVNRYKSLVYTTCTYLGLSQAEAGDAFQQTWVLLYQKRNQIKNPERLSAWLVTTARREAIHLKNRAGVKSVDAEVADFADPNPDPEQEMVLMEQQARLETAVSQLDQPCQAVVEEFFFAPEEPSYEQVARKLGYAPNTLGAKRRRCLEKLRQILEKLGYLCERKPGKEPLR